MTAPAPSAAEAALIDRFGIFDEERVVEAVARAIAQTDYESVIDDDAWEYSFREDERDDFRRYAAAAVAAYRATQDGGECQQSDWCGPGSHCLCPPAAGGADGGLRDALLKHHPIAHTMTGPLKGCRCGQVGLGQDVIAHVAAELRAALAAVDAS